MMQPLFYGTAKPPMRLAVQTRIAAIVMVCLILLFTSAYPGSSTSAQKVENQPENADAKSHSPLVIRVGAIYYDDSAEQYQKIRTILSAFETLDRSRNKDKRLVTFKVVVGTYDEVFHWYKSDQIDLAVMNPGPLAVLLKEFGHEELFKGFIGTKGIVPGDMSIASEEGLAPRHRYNSIMMLNREAIRDEFPALYAKYATDPNAKLSDSEAKQILDLILNKARERQTHFLFVHPFSTSGYIFPRKFLKEQTNVDLTLSDYELTYSHNVSLTELRASALDSRGRIKVAFVSDETHTTKNDLKLLAIRTGDLNTEIVQDALLFTPDFVRRESTELDRIKKLLQSKAEQHTFNLSEVTNNWWKEYDQIGKWIATFSTDKALMSTELTLDQIIRRINNYNLHHPEKPARVALVLSGGGAKCAYQLGAVEVIEERMKKAQSENGAPRPGIDLVVGTSGGAINALTIAAEVTKDDSGRQALRTTWRNFGQSEILKPSDFVRRLLGITLGFIFSLLVINAAYNRRLRLSAIHADAQVDEQKNNGSKLPPLKWILHGYLKLPWSEKVGLLLLLVALPLYLIGVKELPLTRWLAAETLINQHVLIHIAEYGRQTLRWAALCIFVFGLILCLNRSLATRQRAYASFSQKALFPAIVGAVLLFFSLPIITVYTTLKLQNSLFVSSGIDEKLAVEIPKLFSCDASSGSTPQRLANISTEIIQRGLIKRDLVITGSMLSVDSNSRQSDATREANDETDLYFLYLPGKEDLPEGLRKDNRFVSLKDPANESILLDAVIGSGSIFPAYEPKRLKSVKRVLDKEGKSNVQIIDGGFVHNSPIEAAVKLEATHIIMIEASPEYPQSEDVNLLSNSITAFNHLFNQAQLLDARSRRQAEIFTLRPQQDPFLCTMDFGQNYILKAMEWGGQDAKNNLTPRFVRQPRPSGL